MNAKDKKQFVYDLAENFASQVVNRINDGRIPEEWDGHELRQLLADIAADNTYRMSPKQRREYNNTKLVNDL